MSETTTAPPTAGEMETAISEAIRRLTDTAERAVPGPWQADFDDEDEPAIRARTAIANPGSYSSEDLVYERNIDHLWDSETVRSQSGEAVIATVRYIALMSPDVAPHIVSMLRVGLGYARLKHGNTYPMAVAANDLAQVINRDYVR